MKTTGVILAAGQGTRMNSNLPKVLHSLLGKPLVHYSVEVIQQVTEEKPVVVIGHEGEAVKAALGDNVRYVVQDPQLGTGHALQRTQKLLEGKTDLILCITADMPLLQVDTLKDLIKESIDKQAPITMLTVIDKNSRGFGRVIRNSLGSVIAIVEEAQATSEQLAIQELNPSVYCFKEAWLWQALKSLPLSKKGEYYLTDVIEIAVREGYKVHTVPTLNSYETIGINTRVHLAEAESQMRQKINQSVMLMGVSMVDPMTTYIETEVRIGRDSVIWPNTYLMGNTDIGESCEIGPNTVIRESRVGDKCKIIASVIDQAEIESQVNIGPFAHLRKGAHLCDGVHIGNFGEIKNSTLGPGTKIGHFAYIGDATVGAHVNIGAGTITCNFDGVKKNPTEIGAEVFIGSDTMLVAPVKLGEGARTGAGAIVTKDIPPHSLAVGMPARVIRKLAKRD